MRKKESKKLKRAKLILSNTEFRRGTKLETIIDLLPRQTHNGEAYGLMFMQVNGVKSKAYTCCYYSHWVKDRDSSVPDVKGKSMRDAAIKMLRWQVKNAPGRFK